MALNPLPGAASRASEKALVDARRRIGSDACHAWVALAGDELLDVWNVVDDGPLTGTTMGVKDIIDLAGMPTRCGSGLTDPAPVARSASFVARLIQRGVVPVGKTVTAEFAYFAPGPTDNPRAPGHTPGGSSSGSAAAVAAGHVPLALGSQTAGSLIRPAAYCGVPGLVLTHGAVALDGFSGLAPSLDSAGLVANGVRGLAAVVAALDDGPPARGEVDRILVWDGDGLGAVSAAMTAAVRRAAAVLSDRGHHVDALSDPERVAALAADHPVVMAYEAARHREDLFATREALDPRLRALLETGADTPERDYVAALERTAAAREHYAALLGDDGVVLGPAAPGAAPRGLGETGSPVMSRPWQLLGMPQACVPGLVDADGLPLGIQLIAGPDHEQPLLVVAQEWETIIGST